MSKPKFKVDVKNDLCKGCELCAKACPKKLIKKGDKLNSNGVLYVVWDDPEGECIGCGFCYKVCPDCAIEVLKALEDGKVEVEEIDAKKC